MGVDLVFFWAPPICGNSCGANMELGPKHHTLCGVWALLPGGHLVGPSGLDAGLTWVGPLAYLDAQCSGDFVGQHRAGGRVTGSSIGL